MVIVLWRIVLHDVNMLVELDKTWSLFNKMMILGTNEINA